MKDLRYLKWDTDPTDLPGASGTFLKAAHGSGQNRIYYKLSNGNAAAGIYGHESANEVFISRLLSVLGIPHVEYHGARAKIALSNGEHETYVCWSWEFRRPTESKITFETYCELHGAKDPLSFARGLGMTEALDCMLFTDFLVINRDRHGANVEIMRDSRTGRVRLAPVFDNGFSLVAPAQDNSERVKSFDALRDVETNNFIGSRSLFENLELISRPITVNRLTDEALDRAFYGLRGSLTKAHINKIKEIIVKRYTYARNKKVLCER